MKIRFFPLAAPLLVCAALLPAGCNSKANHKSPEAVFSTAQEAMQAKDMEKFMGCLTPEAQDLFAGGLAMAGMMVKAMAEGFSELGAGDAEAKEGVAKLGEVLSKHGLTDEFFKEMEDSPGGTPEDALQKLTEPIKDKPAFVADMMAAMESMGDSSGSGPADAFNGELTDVKIDGDSATGVIVVKGDGGEKKEDLEFRKIDGRWLIHLDPDLGLGGDAPPGL